ncbi:hypothetical protein AX14_002725 [Amanita brunnescens Koide BX004]|nr:hypothetical protein AX14_002725 [Amanita brunnescens Koide BX004]
MAEVMLREVRLGYNVMGIFYGHPGVFVSPSHTAITRARKEGFKAKMLPGISAADCMYADLGFDPSKYGCMTYEATELLLKTRTLDPSVINIIWQVGAVGVMDMSFENTKFALLVDRLEMDLGPDHKLINYVAPILPQSTMSSDIFSISELRNPEVAKKITPISTFYIPPVPSAIRSRDPAMAKQLDLKSTIVKSRADYENEWFSGIDDHVTPADYKYNIASPAVKRFMIDLALNPKLRELYKNDPAAVVFARGDELTEAEKVGLRLDNPAVVYKLMRATQDEISQRGGKSIGMEEVKAFAAKRSSNGDDIGEEAAVVEVAEVEVVEEAESGFMFRDSVVPVAA